MSRDYKKTPPRSSAAQSTTTRKKKGGSTLLGLFIGVLLGLGIAAGAIYYLHRSNSPFKPEVLIPKDLRAQEPGTKEAAAKGNEEGAPKNRASEKDNGPRTDKPRFDFYRILPGTTEPKPTTTPTPTPTPAQTATEGASAVKDKVSGQQEKPVEANTNQAPVAAPNRSGSSTNANSAKGEKSTEAKPTETVKTTPEVKKVPIERSSLQIGAFQNSLDAEDLKAKLAFLGVEAAVQAVNVPEKGVWYRVRVGPYDNADELNKVKAELAKRGFAATAVKP